MTLKGKKCSITSPAPIPWSTVYVGAKMRNWHWVQEFTHDGDISFWLKNYYLRDMRAIDLHVMDTDDKLVFSLHKPPAVIQYQAKISDSNDRPLGIVKKVFSPFLRTHHIRARNSRSPLIIKAPVYRPWTFPVYGFRNREMAKITAKIPRPGQFLSGRETLDVRCSSRTSPEERCLILAAALLIISHH